jgi:hypothetical protein
MSETFAYENLIAGSQHPIVSGPITIELGQVLERGDLIGRELRGTPTGRADVGNTGEGTISNEDLTASAEVGTYTITCIDVGVPAVFSVIDPNGFRLEDATAEQSYSNRINFLIEAYGTPFALGDAFAVDVPIGSLEGKAASLLHLDGGAEPYGILAEDVDASAGAKLASCYREGEFAAENVGFTAGEDADDYREACEAIGIYLRETVEV